MSKKAKTDERPVAPWGAFPLAELIVLAGIVMLAIGLITETPTAIGVGVVLGGLGGSRFQSVSTLPAIAPTPPCSRG